MDLVAPATRGDSEPALLLTAQRCKTLQNELLKQRFDVSIPTIPKILKAEGYSLPANAKTQEGRWNPDWEQQFHHINEQIEAFIQDQQPVITVDTKQKELVGNCKNAGRTWRPNG
ncbi:MAG: hypothetical protein OXE94_03695 [Aestuariivita sp.]|nr:hypothetical protein [Aestuariivita sp.]MCY4202757.1 hypothetical protein [Aestuariivita sp.]